METKHVALHLESGASKSQWFYESAFRIMLAIIMFLVAAVVIYMFRVGTLKGQLETAQATIQELESREPEIEVFTVYVDKAENGVMTGKYLWSETDVEVLAKTVWGEARGCDKLQQSAVVWCILNRVDSEYFPNTIQEVATAPMQFQGYDPGNPVEPEIRALVEDVLSRYCFEKTTAVEDSYVGRTLPSDYYYFVGDGENNYFTKTFGSEEWWTWFIGNPY